MRHWALSAFALAVAVAVIAFEILAAHRRNVVLFLVGFVAGLLA